MTPSSTSSLQSTATTSSAPSATPSGSKTPTEPLLRRISRSSQALSRPHSTLYRRPSGITNARTHAETHTTTDTPFWSISSRDTPTKIPPPSNRKHYLHPSSGYSSKIPPPHATSRSVS
jgi:hypothetical protein